MLRQRIDTSRMRSSADQTPMHTSSPSPYPVEQMGAFLRHAERGDVAGMEALVAQGLSLTVSDAFGDGVLSRMIDHLQDQPREHVLAMVKEAVCLGADPRQLDRDGDDVLSPLVGAMLYMDAALLRFLLEAGADPNALRDMGRLHSLYDWAWTDYQLEEWGGNKIPEQPTDADRATEEGWIVFFDRMAAKYGRRRPDHIAVLRKHGAMTTTEMRAAGMK